MPKRPNKFGGVMHANVQDNAGAGLLVRFGRTETWKNERGESVLLWTVYEALDRDDFVNGHRVAAFECHSDAFLFVSRFDEPGARE